MELYMVILPLKLKGKFCRTGIGQAMLGFDFWAIKRQPIQKMSVAKLRYES